MRFPKLQIIYLASPRGFCAGVERAIRVVELLLKKNKSPIYVRHQIVHNRHIVNGFKKRGVFFVEDIDKIPNGSIVVFSAHGVEPKLYKRAKAKKLKIYDATCPLVAKVHYEAKKYEQQGYFILYIGHRAHPEPKGVFGEVSKKSIVLISNLNEAKSVIPIQKEKLVILTQTTLSFDETARITKLLKERFPKVIQPPTKDICFSTQNRQNAVKELAKKVELILVVGSKESSNSNRLKELSENLNIPSYLINDKTDIKDKWLTNINKLGITAGASVPEKIVEEVVFYLSSGVIPIEEVKTTEEKIKFPLPNNI